MSSKTKHVTKALGRWTVESHDVQPHKLDWLVMYDNPVNTSVIIHDVNEVQ